MQFWCHFQFNYFNFIFNSTRCNSKMQWKRTLYITMMQNYKIYLHWPPLRFKWLPGVTDGLLIQTSSCMCASYMERQLYNFIFLYIFLYLTVNIIKNSSTKWEKVLFHSLETCFKKCEISYRWSLLKMYTWETKIYYLKCQYFQKIQLKSNIIFKYNEINLFLPGTCKFENSLKFAHFHFFLVWIM